MKLTFPFLLAAAIVMSLPAMSQSWSTTGNSGTNPPANFLGTTDAQDLVFKTGNTERGRILSAGGWRFGSTTNYATINAAGKLSFTGTGSYLVGGNKYAFQYDAAPNYGLYFNATARRYEFRNNSAASVFSISADSGTINTSYGYYLNGIRFLSSNGNNTVTFVGNAGNASSTGSSLTGVGHEALRVNTTGYNNVSVGTYSMNTNTTGNNNTATGVASLYSNTEGIFNTANGVYSLNKNTTGAGNTAMGADALYNNSTGLYNVGMGSDPLWNNTTGSYNIATGYLSMYNNMTGNYNVSIGSYAFTTNKYGSYNTALGAYADVSDQYLTNTTSLGYQAIASASNSVVVGNTEVTKIGGYANWTNFSDGRYKKNVKQNVPGLSFINTLQPVTYTLDVSGINKVINGSQKATEAASGTRSGINNNLQATAMEKAVAEKEKKIYTGFIAQDVEKAAQKVNYDFSGVYHPQNDNDYYGLSYADFVVPLVKAVQELSKQNDRKDSVIANLQKQVDDIKTMLSEFKSSQPGASASDAALQSATAAILSDQAVLAQNVPNPYTNTTIIRYTLPQQFTNAIVSITDKSGKVIKQVNVSGSGKGQVTIDAYALSAGTYQYSLIMEGKVIATRQMVLSK